MNQEIKREDILKEREAIKQQRREINEKIAEMTAELRAKLGKLDEASMALIKKCPFHHFTEAFQRCEYCGAIAFPA